MKEAELERGTNSDDEDDVTMEFGEGGASEDLGGAGASSHVAIGTSTLKYRGGSGITSLFNLGAGVLRNGPVKLTPGLSVAKLLDPVTAGSEKTTEVTKGKTSAQSLFENQPAPACSSTAEQSESNYSSGSASTLTESGGEALSLESYLASVGKELGFSESDIEFAVVLHNVVSSSGKFGITKESLRAHSSLLGLEHQLSISEHIQNLINLEMVRF